MFSNRSRSGTGASQANEVAPASKTGTWRRAFVELKKGKLAEENRASRRAYNARDTNDGPYSGNLDQSQSDANMAMNNNQNEEINTVIILP